MGHSCHDTIVPTYSIIFYLTHILFFYTTLVLMYLFKNTYIAHIGNVIPSNPDNTKILPVFNHSILYCYVYITKILILIFFLFFSFLTFSVFLIIVSYFMD